MIAGLTVPPGESPKKAVAAVKAFLTAEFVDALKPPALYATNCGTAIAAKIPMIAMTIINSTSVKPFCPLFL